MRSKARSARAVVVALLVLTFTLVSGATAAATTSYQLAGYEISPGIRSGAVVYGVIFAGRTADGGTWGTSINYAGTPGFGATVVILGGTASGYWVLRTSAGSRSGRVIEGTVTWPSDVNSSLAGCGAGVASFNATVSLSFWNTTTNGGSIHDGCLDDTHLATVFPPRVSGVLTLN